MFKCLLVIFSIVGCQEQMKSKFSINHAYTHKQSQIAKKTDDYQYTLVRQTRPTGVGLATNGNHPNSETNTIDTHAHTQHTKEVT